MKPIYLRAARARQGLSQAELAEKTGIRQNTISVLELRTSQRPTFETVVKLAKALRVDPMRLRFGPDPTQPRHEAKAS